MRLSDANLRGRTVIAADGQIVGEISGFFLNSDTWSIESLQVELRKETADQLGAARSMFRAGSLEIPIRMIQSVGTTVVLAVRTDDLRVVIPNDDQQAPGP
jgi:sporulation protein YlmC with PRC-barrel domain